MLKKLLIVWIVVAALAASYAPDGLAAEKSYAPKTSNERGIKVTVVLKNILTAANTLNFDVVLETHTQSLSDDLVKSFVLIADGKQYLPLAWEGAPPGGHHRKGLLRFKTIAPQPLLLELQLRLSGDVSPRSFKWSLK